jgi:hypothetical protein
VKVMMQLFLLSSGRGPIKLIATESPHWSGIGKGCNGPIGLLVVALLC